MQDYLDLGAEGRMNMPGVAGGNWGWRMQADAATMPTAQRMRLLAAMYGRVPE
jgi:4-alpha-glucanotransferase